MDRGCESSGECRIRINNFNFLYIKIPMIWVFFVFEWKPRLTRNRGCSVAIARAMEDRLQERCLPLLHLW